MTSGNKDEFGQWAFDARRELGLSADWVADRIGVHRTVVVKAENRQRSPKVAKDIARLLFSKASELGVVLSPLPGAEPVRNAAPDDLLAVVRQQAGHIEALTGAIERQSQDIAALADLVRRLLGEEPRRPRSGGLVATLESAADTASAEQARRDLDTGEAPDLPSARGTTPEPRTRSAGRR